jgi:signal transduction histidine kinase
MADALEIEMVLEQIRQVLECQLVCFVPGCPDESLRHPLLDIAPDNFLSPLYCASLPLRREEVAALWQREPGSALCDLALQGGKMFVLRYSDLAAGRWRVRSLAACPVESARGILGMCLLADWRAERFSAGEERLLHACVSMYLPDLEQGLRERARRVLTQQTYATYPGIKREFVSMVGHELRAPLGVVKGYAGLLQAYGGVGKRGDQALAPEQQQRYVQAIIEQTALLEVLVNDLLDAACLQRGELALSPGVVDVRALCRQAVEFEQVRAEHQARGKYRLECRTPVHQAFIRADAQRLQQVLLNLLDNAIKYSPRGGRIELEVRETQRRDETVAITIRDRGVGIPTRLLSALFQPFERLERPAIARIAGAGLGLYIARRLVEAMEGKIEIESCEGCGTNVTIHLPTAGLVEACAADAPARLPAISPGSEVRPEAGFLQGKSGFTLI